VGTLYLLTYLLTDVAGSHLQSKAAAESGGERVSERAQSAAVSHLSTSSESRDGRVVKVSAVTAERNI